MFRERGGVITVDLPIKTGSGLNERVHWGTRARMAKLERGTSCLMVKAKVNWAGSRTVVKLTRYSFGELDDDNLKGSLKSVRDGVADAFGIADNDKRVKWEYAQEKCKRGAYGVRIQIEQA